MKRGEAVIRPSPAFGQPSGEFGNKETLEGLGLLDAVISPNAA